MIETALRNSYKLRINIRPIKHAYFIFDDDWTALTNVMQLACTQWGGIRSLIIPVKNDLSISTIFDQLIKLHEPDRLVGYLTDAANRDYKAHNQLQRQLGDLFPKRRISLEDGRFYAQNDMTAHALHILTDDDLRNRNLIIQRWTPKPSEEQIPLAVYGATYPGQEEFYETTIQTTSETIEIGSKEFWESQITGDPFASVINLTAYNISAHKVIDWFESNEFDIVAGEDINSICMYWNFRATREATHFSSTAKRRTILAPFSALENRTSLDQLVEVLRTHFPTPGISSNLNIIFNVWGKESQERLSQILSQATDQLEKLTEHVDCNNMCYISKPSENAKFSRVFDDSSLQKV